MLLDDGAEDLVGDQRAIAAEHQGVLPTALAEFLLADHDGVAGALLLGLLDPDDVAWPAKAAMTSSLR